MQQKKRRTLVLLFCTPSGCSGNALCANTARFYTYCLVVVEQKYRIRQISLFVQKCHLYTTILNPEPRQGYKLNRFDNSLSEVSADKLSSRSIIVTHVIASPLCNAVAFIILVILSCILGAA